MFADTNGLDVVIGLFSAAAVVLASLIAVMVRRRGVEHGSLHEVVARIDERTKRMEDVQTQHITDHGIHNPAPRPHLIRMEEIS